MNENRSSRKSSLLYASPSGTRYLRRDEAGESTVSVEQGGACVMRYSFPNVPLFSHPMLSWRNLDCCGKWSFDEEYLLYDAVQTGQKAVAQIIRYAPEREELASLSQKILAQAGRPLTHWQQLRPFRGPHGPGYRLDLLLRLPGALETYFDREEILAHYGRLGIPEEKLRTERLEQFFRLDLAELFSYDAAEKYGYDFANASRADDFIVTGLALGYPIETTASLLKEFKLV